MYISLSVARDLLILTMISQTFYEKQPQEDPHHLFFLINLKVYMKLTFSQSISTSLIFNFMFLFQCWQPQSSFDIGNRATIDNCVTVSSYINLGNFVWLN